MATNLKPSSELVSLAKFGLIPGIIIASFFCIGGVVAIFLFLEEYYRTNQEQPVLLAVIVFIALAVVISAFQLVFMLKFMKMKPKNISLRVKSGK